MKGPLFKIKGEMGPIEIKDSMFINVDEILEVDENGKVKSLKFEDSEVMFTADQQGKLRKLIQDGASAATIIALVKAFMGGG